MVQGRKVDTGALGDFELPPERIALRPAEPRDNARLLVVRPAGVPELDDRTVADLPALLAPGDQVVVNDTKVIAASLTGRRVSRTGEPTVLVWTPDGSTRSCTHPIWTTWGSARTSL